MNSRYSAKFDVENKKKTLINKLKLKSATLGDRCFGFKSRIINWSLYKQGFRSQDFVIGVLLHDLVFCVEFLICFSTN